MIKINGAHRQKAFQIEYSRERTSFLQIKDRKVIHRRVSKARLTQDERNETLDHHYPAPQHQISSGLIPSKKKRRMYDSLNNTSRSIISGPIIVRRAPPPPTTGRLSISPNPKLVDFFENMQITTVLLLILVCFLVLYLVNVFILWRLRPTPINSGTDETYNSYPLQHSVWTYRFWQFFEERCSDVKSNRAFLAKTLKEQIETLFDELHNSVSEQEFNENVGCPLDKDIFVSCNKTKARLINVVFKMANEWMLNKLYTFYKVDLLIYI